MRYLEATDRADTFVEHAFEEHLVDLGEIRMNYVAAGSMSAPALVLVPAQGESWWGYEAVIPILAEQFRVFAIDLRGQGRSTWTPGRYTLDNFGGDVVRFLDLVVGRPAIVAGLSSGGVVTAWLSAFAKPGQLRGAYYEDAPLFASEVDPAVGPSIRQAIGPVFAAWSKWLGDQWSIGDFDGMQRAFADEVPISLLTGLSRMSSPADREAPRDVPGQALKEYDPEWGRAFSSGTAAASCDHDNLLGHVAVPVLFTHHFHEIDPSTGRLVGALSDLQVKQAEARITEAGQPFTYLSFPEMPHSMHGADPERYAATLISWAATLP